MTNPETPLEIAKRIANCHVGATEADALALARALIEADHREQDAADQYVGGGDAERSRIVAAIRTVAERNGSKARTVALNLADWIESGCPDE